MPAPDTSRGGHDDIIAFFLSTNFEFRNPKWFGRFDKLTAGRLTTLHVLSGVEGSNIEGQIRIFCSSGRCLSRASQHLQSALVFHFTLRVRRVVVQVAQGGAEACPRAIQPNSLAKNRQMVSNIFIPT
jgi:hypothetical protein